jgi:hypothetical protein
MTDSRLHDREILISAMREILALAEEQPNVVLRKPLILEATRLGVRLLNLQKEIADYDLD